MTVQQLIDECRANVACDEYPPLTPLLGQLADALEALTNPLRLEQTSNRGEALATCLASHMVLLGFTVNEAWQTSRQLERLVSALEREKLDELGQTPFQVRPC